MSAAGQDRLGRALSEVVGGPAGRRAAVAPGVRRPVAVLVVLALAVLALGVVQKQHCRAEGWSTPDMFAHACYSDLPVVYESSGLADGESPWAAKGADLDQPVLTGLALWQLAQLTPGTDRPASLSFDEPAGVSAAERVSRDRGYFDRAVVALALLLVGLVALVAASAGRRPWDATLVALSPLLATVALVSLDLLGVVLATGGLVAWGRRRPVLAGALLGLATAARTYPALLLVVLVLLAVRTAKVREVATTVGVAALTWLLLTLTPSVLGGGSALAAYSTWRASGAGYGSPWLLPQLLGRPRQQAWERWLGLDGAALSPTTVTGLTVAGLVLAVCCGLLLTLAAPQRPRVAQVAVVVVGIALITSKALPVQSSLWLLPLAALAVPRWRDHLVWAGCELAYFAGVWVYLLGNSDADRGLPPRLYAVLLLVRLAGILWLVVAAWRSAWRVERDPVRTDGEDDPLGGAHSGAQDRLVVRFTD